MQLRQRLSADDGIEAPESTAVDEAEAMPEAEQTMEGKEEEPQETDEIIPEPDDVPDPALGPDTPTPCLAYPFACATAFCALGLICCFIGEICGCVQVPAPSCP